MGKQEKQQATPKDLPESNQTHELKYHYWESINYVTGLIKASELKAGLILSFYGILLNLVYQSIGLTTATSPIPFPVYLLLGLWGCCTAISIYFSIRCFIPRIEMKYEKNIFFFRDVITKFGTIKEFSKTFHQISTDEEQLFEHLGQQIFIISKIAAVKFKNVKRSLKFLALGLFIMLLLIGYYIIFPI